MQTIRIPWRASNEDCAIITEWQRARAAATRTAYANANGRSEKDLRDLLKARFPSHPLGSWDLHCAAREGLRLRAAVPDGKMIFGGRPTLLRRQKGLIDNTEWKSRRHQRAIEIVGDRTRWGNRHFRLSEDGRTCEVIFLKQKASLKLPEMNGKQGRLLRSVAKLADACQISVTFTLGRTHLSVTFDEMDLRKLAPGKTLEQAKIAEQGKGRRGRKRKNASTHYAAHREKHIPAEEWPVHPEWRDTMLSVTNRAIGIDLNPGWIGVSVIEVGSNPANLEQVKILNHQLHKIAVPFGADQSMQQVMANVAAKIINLARAWNVGLIVHEEGLGKLAWSKKSRNTQTINYWSRNVLISGLQRRCRLAGIQLQPVWGGYSSTIGNLFFDLPDACGAAAEIARRGLSARAGIKDRLPAVPPQLDRRRWKDDEPRIDLDQADTWQEIHRKIKPVQAGSPKRPGIGYRRLHPTAQQMDSGSFSLHGRSYAVDRFGKGKGASCSARPVLHEAVRNSSDRVRNA
tara:strand:- start:178 stop:1722 length:1545 start_codon:yes stop_codon:yes gene_type:complete